MKKQNLNVLLLINLIKAYIRRNVPNQIANVPLHHFGLAVWVRLNCERLIQANHSYQILTELCFENVKVLLWKFLLQVGSIGCFKFPKLSTIDNGAFLGFEYNA